MKKKWILAEIAFALGCLVACGDGDVSKPTSEDESLYYLQDADYYAGLMSSAMEACKSDPTCAGKIGGSESSSSSEASSSSFVSESSSQGGSSLAESSSSEILSSSAAMSSSSSESSSSAAASSSSEAASSSSEASSSSSEAASSSSEAASSSSEAASSSSEASSSSSEASSSSSEASSSSSEASSSSSEAASSSSEASSSSSEEASSSSGSEIVYTDKTLDYDNEEVEISAGAYHIYSTNQWSGVLRCKANVETEVLVEGKSVTIGTSLNSVDGANPRTNVYVTLIVPENKSIFCKAEW